MYSTKNDLPAATRKQIVELCNARLAEAIDLQTQCKQAHWNVKGPTFIALHELFDQIQARIDVFVDDIAERAVSLGGAAHGTAQVAVKESKLEPYPTELMPEKQHLTALADRLSAFGKLAREARSSRRTKSVMRIPPTSSPRSRAARTNGSGSWSRTCRPSDSLQGSSDHF